MSLAVINQNQLTEKSRCPKCGLKALERDGTDLHCWSCGKIFYYVFTESQEGIEITPKVITETSHKVEIVSTDKVSIQVPKSNEILEQSQKPEKPKRPKRDEFGHCAKVYTKIPDVIRLINSGHGIRAIIKETGLAQNTIREIIDEHSLSIDFESATKTKKETVKQHKQTIIPALKGLASSAKCSQYSYELMFTHAENILIHYMKTKPIDTVKALLGDSHFTIDDLLKKTYEIVLAQRLRLDDDFIELETGIFKLKAV